MKFVIEKEGREHTLYFLDSGGRSTIYRGSKKGCEWFKKLQHDKLKHGGLVHAHMNIWR